MIFRAEITWAPVSHANGTPVIAFVVSDSNESFSILLRRDDGTGNSHFQLFFNAGQNGNGSFISGTSVLTGVGTTAYDSGGTLAFEKDSTTGVISWITPLGTESRGGFGSTNEDPLEPVAFTTGILRSPTNVNSSVYVDWTDFEFTRDGAPYISCALTAADPGLWFDPQDTYTNGGAGGPMVLDNSQGASAYRSGLVYVHALHNPRHTETREWRTWQGGFNVGANPWQILIDAVMHPGNGDVVWARVPSHDKDTLLFGYTNDGGVTLTEVTVTTNPGSEFAYPAIDVDAEGRVLIFWSDRNDRTRLWCARSGRYGRGTWDSVLNLPMPGGINSGVVQGFRIHPFGGPGLVVIQQPSVPAVKAGLFHAFDRVTGPVWLRDPFPSMGTSFEAYGTVWFDGQGYTYYWGTGDGGSPFVSSGDWGHEWFGSYNNSENTDHYRFIYVPWIGLQYYLRQNQSSGDLKAAPNDDQTVIAPVDTTRHGAPAWVEATAVAGALQQYAMIVSGPGGLLYLLYQTLSAGVYSPACKVSRDHGGSWSVP